MKRKLIKQGEGGFTLYLPKKWVESKNLKAGEEIELKEVNDNIVILNKNKTKKQTIINLEDAAPHEMYIKLSHAYRAGFDIIKIIYKGPTLKKIKEIITNNLLGFEIIEQEKNTCTIENIVEPTDEKFSVLLRRIFLLIKSTYHEIKEDFIDNKKRNLKEIESLRTSLDKYVFFCRRLINKRMYLEENTILHWELLTFLMHIQHAMYYMYKYYHKNKYKINSKTVTIIYDIEKYIDNYYKSYFEKNEHYLDINEKIKEELNKEIYKQLESQNPDNVILSFIREIVRLIQVGGSPIRVILVDQQPIQ